MAAEMRMSEAEFFDCTPRYFVMRRTGWLENRQGMEEARFLAYYMLKTVDSKNKIRRLTDVCRFPWDRARRNKTRWAEWDPEEMQAYSDAADRALQVLNPAAWAVYMEGKRKREEEAAAVAAVQMDPEMMPQGELDI